MGNGCRLQRLTLAALLLLLLLLAAPAEALTIEVPRISRTDARYATHAVFDTYAESAGHRLVIAPCKPAGRLSRVCIARVGHERFRVVARYANAELEVIVQHRRLVDR